MDQRHQVQEYPGSNSQNASSNNFNGLQNDAFNTFVNTDNESAFDSSWGNQPMPTQQQPNINSFNQGSHGWQQTPYQPSNFFNAANYGASRDFEQPYSRSPSSFNYPSFDPHQNPAFAPSTYEGPPNPYEDPLYGSVNNNPQFEFSGSTGLQQHHNTISPQALQTYPSAFSQSTTDDSHQVRNQYLWHASLAR